MQRLGMSGLVLLTTLGCATGKIVFGDGYHSSCSGKLSYLELPGNDSAGAEVRVTCATFEKMVRIGRSCNRQLLALRETRVGLRSDWIAAHPAVDVRENQSWVAGVRKK